MHVWYSKGQEKGKKGTKSMGMSASQVRFLTLQHRKHNIGTQLTALSNKKMALSRDMNKVAKNYTNRLNQSRLKWSNDSGFNYTNLSYDLLMKPNELNCEKPYIITDKNGRVVLDDRKVYFNSETNQLEYDTANGMTYKEIAAMISSYSGVDKTTGKTLYNNVGNAESNINVTMNSDGDFESISTAALSGGKSLDDAKYEIRTGDKVYNYDSSLRFDIMEKLGLIPSETKAKFKSVLNELYGNKAGADFEGSMEKMLKDFDLNHEFKVDDKFGYSTYFGSLTTSDVDGSFSLEGGCALGNLALAKAYQREYEAFLNTDIVHELHQRTARAGGSNYRDDVLFTVTDANHVSEYRNEKGSMDGITESYDASHTIEAAAYGYVEEEKTGISRRIANLLYVTKDKDTEVIIDSNGNATLRVNDILSNLKFYTSGDANATTVGSFAGVYDYSRHDIDGTTEASGEWYWTQLVAEWDKEGYVYGEEDVSGTIYEQNGGSNTFNQVTDWSYLYDNTYYGGETAKAGTDNAARTRYSNFGVTLRTGEYSGDHTQSLGESHAMLNLSSIGKWANETPNSVYGVLESLRDSFLHFPGIDKGGVQYAYVMTKHLYRDGINDTDADGPNYIKASNTREAATNNSFNLYGTRWADKVGWKNAGCDVTAVNTTHLIDAFATFYEMYVAVGGNVGHTESRSVVDEEGITLEDDVWYTGGMIVNTAESRNGEKVFVPELTGAANQYFDSSVAEKMGDSTVDKMALIWQNWKSGFTDAGYDQTSATVKTYNYTTDDGSAQAKITYDASGKITNMVFSYTQTDSDGNSHTFTDKEVSYSGSDLVVQNHSLTYNSDGTPTGCPEAAITKYHTDGTADIEFKSGFEIRGGEFTVEEYAECPVSGCDKSSKHTHNRGTASSITMGKPAGGSEYTITRVNGNESNNGNWKEVANRYVIVKGTDSTTIDPDYEYLSIDASSPIDGKSTKKITTKSDNKYGDKIDQLVADCQERVDELQDELENCFAGISPKLMEYFDGLFKRISEKGWVVDPKVNSTNSTMSQNYLEAMLENGEYFITEYNSSTDSGSYDYVTKQASSIMKIYKVRDESLENIALSEYEAAKTLISNKERVIDARMQKLETEQEAITTELQSIKKVRNENIEKTFKIFA